MGTELFRYTVYSVSLIIKLNVKYTTGKIKRLFLFSKPSGCLWDPTSFLLSGRESEN